MLEEYKSFLATLTKLSREEEEELWKQYKGKDLLEARQSLIEHYQPLVFREAMKYGLQEAVTLDLIQEGTVGLMEAVERYDPSLGVAFSLYALHRVRGRMLNFLRKNGAEVLLEDGEEEKVFLTEAIPDTAFESADKSVLNMAVSHAVSRLPLKEQDVIRRVYLNEQTAAETADAMDVSTAYVYRLEKRGIRRLRGMLSKLIHDRK
ncbi:sigma-70 family RNA polymerase sigma factor [uncultured Dialister sp.]|jgi:RNA polymerase sigma factor (sigma-70 family)|uniref:sigma-70 family RNA polymerase sigma factor n=1 Tax=uncultured Dialister sp. TaxID=278064 RepID=UPI0025F8B54D|nr:sigma-70 family RNA polymerase sigma factor [uncultured Dialister sp.]